ncbi:hypothetical protein BS78_10G213400 [Paspalum vaginatum]|nr:hypothetical protein BS78_10G213400 [Paspalum vaginatum]
MAIRVEEEGAFITGSSVQNPHASWWMLAACLSIGSSTRRRAGSSTPRMRPAPRAAVPRGAALRLSGVQRHVPRGVLIEWALGTFAERMLQGRATRTT